jgi:hypothetical protein
MSIAQALLVLAMLIARASAARADSYGADFCAGYLKIWTNDTCKVIADDYVPSGPEARCVGNRRAYATFRAKFGFTVWVEASNTCTESIDVSFDVKKDDGRSDRYTHSYAPDEKARYSHFGFRNKQPFNFTVTAKSSKPR